jgi:hypothetical protein
MTRKIKCDKKRCQMNKKGYKNNCCFFDDIRICENSPIYDKNISKKYLSKGELIFN